MFAGMLLDIGVFSSVRVFVLRERAVRVGMKGDLGGYSWLVKHINPRAEIAL
jgi:hypothetical protein